MRIVKTGILCGLILMGIATGAFAAKIGVAQQVKNKVTGDANNTERQVRKGGGIFQNELIKTGWFSKADLRFVDETRLSIGAKSTVRLDSFVYNPRTRTGKIVINTIKGAFRFVSGTARKSAYRIKTPLATIGVRGTVIDGYTDRRAGVYILQQGGMEVCTGSVCRNVDRPGDFVVVKADGSITLPKKWTGRVRGVNFETTFPVGRGRFHIDSSHFDSIGKSGGGESYGGYSSQSPSSSGY